MFPLILVLLMVFLIIIILVLKRYNRHSFTSTPHQYIPEVQLLVPHYHHHHIPASSYENCRPRANPQPLPRAYEHQTTARACWAEAAPRGLAAAPMTPAPVFMAPTKKHAEFVASRINGKRIADVPGIGPAYSKVLNGLGYHRASDLLNEFRVRGPAVFSQWLKQTARMKPQFIQMTTDALREYCEHWGW